MPLQSSYQTTTIIFSQHSLGSKKQHSRHQQTTETPSRRQNPPFQCQAQVQNHQSLPLLLQRPRLCHPAPSTSTTNSTPIPAISKKAAPSCTASDLLYLMDILHIPVEADTYASLLHECARSGDLIQVSAVHAHIRRRFAGHRFGLGLANRLLFMYAACGQPKLARQLFDQMPLRDSISRVITMSGLSESNDDVGVLRVFVGMHPGREDWWLLNPLGFKVVLWSCARARELRLGQQLHGLAVKFTGCSSFAEHLAPLVNFYAMLNYPDLALRMMLASPFNDCEEVVWVSIVLAYDRDGCVRKALLAFREMERRRRIGVYQNRKRRCKMFTIILATCAKSNEKEGYEGGRQVHAIAIKNGVDRDPYVGCSLVELYSKQGLLVQARRVFETVKCCRRDAAACWNKMLGG